MTKQKLASQDYYMRSGSTIQYMLRNFVFLSILFTLPLYTFAQSGIVHGKITSSSGELLPGATVLADSITGVSSDLNGHFELKLNPGIYSLRVKLISFTEKYIQIELKPGENRELNIILEPSSRELKLVVVSAGKFEQKIEDVTVSIEVLKPHLVEQRATTTMEDAMDYVPGVNIIDGQANIRGGSGWSYGAGSRVQVLVDDLPMLTADAGDAKWSFLPVENLEQVEVIKGASSVLFGSSALNGAINLRTAFPRDTPMTKINFLTGVYDHATVKFDTSEYDLNSPGSIRNKQGVLSFLHSRQIGNLDLVAGGNMFIDEGYREGENEQHGRFNLNTRYRFKNIEGLSAGINGNVMMSAGTLFFIWKNDSTGAYQPAPTTLSDYTTYRTNLDPFITYIGKKGSSHKIRTRWFNSKNENNTNQESTGNVYYAEYQFQKRFGEKATVTAGLVDQENKVKSELYLDHSGNQLAAYVQGDVKWKILTFSAGARVEQNKIDSIREDWNPVFRGGINAHILKGTYLRASIGQGYRFPSVAERFVRTNVGSLYIYPNPGLNSEKGYSAEVGFRQVLKFGSWIGYFDAAAFQSQYENMMEFIFAQWGKPSDPLVGFGFSSVNVGKTKIKGFDLSLMAEGKIVGELSATLMLSYTYLDPKQTTYDSAYVAKAGIGQVRGSDSTDFLKYRFRHMGKADLEFNFRKFSLGGSLRYNSKMENIDYIFLTPLFDQISPPGLGIGDYRLQHDRGDLVLDARAGYQLNKNVKATFIVKNVTNYIYMQRPADMQAPRIFFFQLGITL